jgi:hypothetical protein
MREQFEIVRGDTSPSLGYALPTDVNITLADVVFNMRRRSAGTVVIERVAARIVTTTPPVVAYDWAEGDTDEAGFFVGEFELTYSDDAVETFPVGGIPITIAEDIA